MAWTNGTDALFKIAYYGESETALKANLAKIAAEFGMPGFTGDQVLELSLGELRGLKIRVLLQVILPILRPADQLQMLKQSDGAVFVVAADAGERNRDFFDGLQKHLTKLGYDSKSFAVVVQRAGGVDFDAGEYLVCDADLSSGEGAVGTFRTIMKSVLSLFRQG